MTDFRALFSKIVYSSEIIFGLAKWFFLLLVIFLVVNTFFVALFIVDGVSMEPTLHDGEFVLWQKNSYFKENPQRGDIVLVNYPGDPLHKKYVKRVVGLPGEKVKIVESKVYVNDKLLKQEYLAFDVLTLPEGSWDIAAGKYFVMGDNRENSNDSRFFGPVEKRFILGKAIATIFKRFSVL